VVVAADWRLAEGRFVDGRDGDGRLVTTSFIPVLPLATLAPPPPPSVPPPMLPPSMAPADLAVTLKTLGFDTESESDDGGGGDDDDDVAGWKAHSRGGAVKASVGGKEKHVWTGSDHDDGGAGAGAKATGTGTGTGTVFGGVPRQLGKSVAAALAESAGTPSRGVPAATTVAGWRHGAAPLTGVAEAGASHRLGVGAGGRSDAVRRAGESDAAYPTASETSYPEASLVCLRHRVSQRVMAFVSTTRAVVWEEEHHK
jgi:hypothetical protein